MSKITLNRQPATADDVEACINALLMVQDKYRHHYEFRICLALNSLWQERRISRVTYLHLVKYINRQLGGFVTLGSWHLHRLHKRLAPREEHQARLDWIDYMIEQYQALLPTNDN